MAALSNQITIGRRVILDEAAALTKLAESLNDAFPAAIDALANASGRVIVSGMGKSGHIARKIAATFASTGTPAHFVHAAEASHGDMGMLAVGDVLLVVSNSGETPELANVVSYSRRFEIPLIGIVGRVDSTLAQQADVTLVLPDTGEACGQNFVPTNSTTMALALGDAIAIALMEHRDFTPENFRDFHPGGKLGARLSQVRDLMHAGDALPLAYVDTPMSEALLTISQKGFGLIGVLDAEQSLVGIITDGDLRRNMVDLLRKTAGEVMTRNPVTIAPNTLAHAAVAIMNGSTGKKMTGLLVADPAAPRTVLGVLHIHDCLRAGVV